jgi:nucleotidyltransferase substrate binding protein (TIGR01987 family)
MTIEVLRFKINDLERSLARYKEVVDQKKSNIVRDSVIQRFEFTFELFWKVLKKILSYEGEDTTTPRHTLSKAYQYQLINNETIWIDMMLSRNKTSHMYDEREADIIYNKILSYYPVMYSAFVLLKTKYCSKE